MNSYRGDLEKHLNAMFNTSMISNLTRVGLTCESRNPETKSKNQVNEQNRTLRAKSKALEQRVGLTSESRNLETKLKKIGLTSKTVS